MELLEVQEEKLARAISASSRRQILRLLAESDLTVSDISAKLGFSTSLVSKHLTLLHDLGFLNAKLKSPYKYYSLKDPQMKILLEKYNLFLALFSEDLSEAGEEQFFRAIGASSRRAILKLLSDKERTVTEITQFTGQSKSLASRHLKLLYDSGLLNLRRVPPHKYYALKINDFKQLLDQYDLVIDKL